MVSSEQISIILFNKKKHLFSLGVVLLILSCLSLFKLSIDGNLTGNMVQKSSFYQAAIKINEVFKLGNIVQVKIVPKQSITYGEFVGVIQKIQLDVKKNYPTFKSSSILDFQRFNYLEKIKNTDNILSSFSKLKQMPIAGDFISKDSLSTQITFNVGDKLDVTFFDKLLKKPYPEIKKIVPFSKFHIERSVAGFITKDMSILSSLMILLSFLVMIITFRNLKYVFLCLLFLGFGVLTSLASFVVFDVNINVVTILVLPIMIVLTLSDIIHLLSGIRFGQHTNKQDNIIGSIKEYLVPSLLTSVTTSIAFFSFSFSAVPNMREFGMVSSFGVMLTFIITFLMSPYLMDKVLDDGEFKSLDRKTENKYLNQIINGMNSFRTGIVIMLILLSVTAIFKIKDLEFKTGSSLFFPEGSDLFQVHDELNSDFNSLVSLDILISPPDFPIMPKGFTWDTSQVLETIYNLNKRISNLEHVQNVSSIGNVLEYFYNKGLTSSDLDNKEFVNKMWQKDQHLMRVWFRHADDAQKVYSELQNILNDYNNEVKADVSSVVLLNSEVDLYLAKGIFYSLITSGILIFIILLHLSGSVRATMACLIVNCLPLSGIVVIFYYLGFKLNLITAMCSVICLGIIVDDTIHIIYRWKRGKSIKKLSYSMLTTSIILSIGFGMFSFSNFEPSRILGLVCAMTFLLAVVADVSLLPWLLKMIKEKEK